MPAETKHVMFKGYRTGSTERSALEKPTKEGDMYPMQWPPYDNSDVEKRISGVLGPLSLFAPFPHENTPEEKPVVVLERPVTPIDEEIKSQPMSFDKLAKYIRRRIAAKPDIPHLSIEDQQMLAGILMGEVTGIWPDIRRQIDDPFLSAEENRELNRRIAVHIVNVCEQLFLHYLDKAQVLNGRGIFSGPANMSRLKAQLALDANKFLNILTIRRYIVEDMRGAKEEEESLSSENFTYTTQKPKVLAPKLSYKGLIETSRPKSKMKRFVLHSPENEAKKITNTMPNLDTSKLVELISDLPERQLEAPTPASSHASSRASVVDRKSSGVSKEELSLQKVLLKRSNSLPEIPQGETLMEELGIDESVRKDELEQHELGLLKRDTEKRQQRLQATYCKSPEPGTRDYAAADLRKLMSRSQQEFKVEEDMPPLLQAVTTSAKHDGKKKILEQKLKELEEKERKANEEANIPLRGPTHPQPATVSTKLPNQMVVRASDIRVSERVCMSSITIDRFATVYNDLTEEIDPHTVKLLDRNLFLGDEIREVYQEIMKTVPSSHLDLDDDEMVVPAAENVNISGTMASASLARKRSDRVINPVFLKENRKPPWGEMDHKQWVKTPNNPPKNFQGEDLFAPITPNMDKVHEVIRNPSKMSKMLTADGMPSFVQDKMARTYASWLQWWKSTITSDDYMKYLSTQETDYMGCVFHFYDSDEEDEEEEMQGMAPIPTTTLGTTVYSRKLSPSRTTRSSKLSEQKEKERKLEELKAQKQEYKEGFWNVNSVLLGGLGKDPQVEDELVADPDLLKSCYSLLCHDSSLHKASFCEAIFISEPKISIPTPIPQEEDDASSKPPKSADTSRSSRTLRERAAARHSAKMEKSSRHDVLQSRASKVTTLTNLSKLETERSTASEEDQELSPQDRLERVWSSLEMPDSLKLDMAIKYSCNEFFIKLNEAIDRWEKTTDLIMKREQLLSKLEKFEREASDPNRFFDKGNKRSSVQRLREAQQRSFFYRRIDLLDSEIKHELQYMKEKFKDVITFKGRPYQDKMKWDRIEMLHWLQEERKQNALKYEAMSKQMPQKSTHLEPIKPVYLPFQTVQ